MRGKLFTFVSVVSLLLCVVLWVRSYWVELRVGSSWEEREISLCIVQGHVALEIWDRWFHPEDRAFFFAAQVSPDLSSIEEAVTGPTDAHLRRYGRFGYYYVFWSIPDDGWHWVIVPAWFAVCLLATPLAFALRSSAFSRPPRAGFCRCTYNLTGNTSGVCPECGMAVAGKVGA